MNKKNIKFDFKWLVIVGISVFAFSSFAFAAYEISQNSEPQVINIEKVEFSGPVTFNSGVPEMISEDVEFGGTSHMTSDVIATGAWTITGAWAFSGAMTLSGDNTLSGTTTIRYMDASFQTDIDFQAGTSTTGVILEGTEVLIASVQNTGADLLCTDVWFDISASNDVFAYALRVGSSTTATSSAAAFITRPDTTAGRIGTNTVDIFNKEDDEGTVTDDVWVWKAGWYITATMSFDITNATSAASFTAEGGNKGVGKLHGNCRTRY